MYRARDTRLERTVAIKILPSHFSAGSIHKQRFEREAKTISQLNHPHICVLYDIGHQDGIDYLVMECVEGETLAKRLEKGPLPLEQLLKYGAQVADALDKAHHSGVVHRDLKPGNIMLTASGAKLLDFGLAKPAAPLVNGATLTAVATPTTSMTQEGTILGTFQYMSPEQVEGKELDGRSDIFSLGAVLYEMVTGQRTFEGKSQLSVASAILEKEPAPLSTIKPMTPPGLEHAVKKCLAKTAEERWQSASDLASELKWIAESAGHTAGAVSGGAGKAREGLGWLVACTLLIVLIVGAIWWRSPKPAEQTMYFSAPFPFPARHIAVAPNGRTIAVVAYLESARKDVLWIYELGSQEFRSVADSEGASFPFWSADGQFLAFFADGKLKDLQISGGTMRTICDAPSGRGGTWNKDGVIVFTPDAALGKGLYRVPAAGGAPEQISRPDPSRGEDSHRYPMFLPDGGHYLYMTPSFSGRKGVDAIFVGSLNSNEKRFVVEADANAAYAAPGYLVFYKDKSLLAQRFDLRSLALTGQPTTVLTDVENLLPIKWAVFAVSDTGLLVAQRGSAVTLSQPVWFDREGKELGVVGQPAVYGNVSIAPNGRSVAVNKTDPGSLNTDIWTHDLQRGTAKRLTFNTAFIAGPLWSPDASRLVYFSNQGHGNDLYVKNSDGSQEEKLILHDDLDKFANDWSRNGKYLLYTRGSELWTVTFPELKSSLFLKAPSILGNGQFSPDAKWVAYASNETGKWEIYVTSFPDARGKWQVSTGGGEQPRWRGDGREIFYLSSDSKMMAAPVTTGGNFDSGRPVSLFQATPRQPISSRDQFVYDASKDGQHFLILTQRKQADAQPMTIILNWTAKLNK